MSSGNYTIMPKNSRELVQVFEIAGTYLIGVFYNSLYRRAVMDTRGGKFASITDAYRKAVEDYVIAMANTERYRASEIYEMSQTFNKHNHFGATTFAEFEDYFLGAMIPREFYTSFTGADKDRTLHEIVTKTVAELAKQIIAPAMIRKIIDDHNNQYNVMALQRIVHDILCARRDEYYAKFAQEVIREKVPGANIDMDNFNKLRTSLADELQKRMAAERELKKAKTLITKVVQSATTFRAENEKLKAQIQQIRDSGITRVETQEHARREEPPRYRPSRQRSPTPWPREQPVEEIMDYAKTEGTKENKGVSSSSSETNFFLDDEDADNGFGI